jgi:hypothetical protein
MAAYDPFAALNSAVVRTFGVSAEYLPVGATTSISIKGVWQRDSDEERHSDGLYARLFITAADVSALPQEGDAVTVGGETFVVFNAHVDAVGGAWVTLRKR